MNRQSQTPPATRRSWLSDNWFKLTLIAAFGWFVFQNNLSFTFNYNGPAEAPGATEKPIQPLTTEEPVRFSDKKTTSLRGALSQMKLPLFGGRSADFDGMSVLEQTDETVIRQYLERFAQVALSEQRKYGIPASIILANALLHSGAGQRPLVEQGENHFSIQCGDATRHESFYVEDRCFRKYKNAWSSFRDHSNHVTSGRFKALRALSGKGYRAWTAALEDAEFSRQTELEQKLNRIIEQFGLDKLDT